MDKGICCGAKRIETGRLDPFVLVATTWQVYSLPVGSGGSVSDVPVVVCVATSAPFASVQLV